MANCCPRCHGYAEGADYCRDCDRQRREGAAAVGQLWIAVANVRGGGTKHFVAGAKVYCLSVYSDGRARILGRHRGGARLVELVVPRTWLTNARAQQVYSPRLAARLGRWWYGVGARGRAEDDVAMLKGAGDD